MRHFIERVIESLLRVPHHIELVVERGCLLDTILASHVHVDLVASPP